MQLNWVFMCIEPETDIQSMLFFFCSPRLIHVIPSSSHRHIRYSLFFHSLSLIACLKQGGVSKEKHNRYLSQVNINQELIKK